MLDIKKIITNRLKSLVDIEGVTVTQKGKTLHVEHKNEHSLDFSFEWKDAPDRFVGKFVDHEGNKSQAVIALKNGLDAIHFATAYSLLVKMRAKRT